MIADGSDGRDPGCCAVELSEAVEDYLKTLHAVTGEGEPVTTSRVAVRLGVSPPSVSAMMGRLTSAGLVTRVGRQIELTEHGARHAQAVVRRHRLLETFLARMLGVPWDEVHAEAERLEHALSDRLADRIASALGDPRHDPHGAPIPPRDGSYREDWPDPLSTAPVGSRFRVERVCGRHGTQLRYLGDLGIRPGVTLLVEERAPFGGPLWVSVDGRRHGLGEPLTHRIHGVVDTGHDQRGSTADDAMGPGSEAGQRGAGRRASYPDRSDRVPADALDRCVPPREGDQQMSVRPLAAPTDRTTP